MQIRALTKELLPQALDLLSRSDSTPRTQETWEGNHLQGVCVFEGNDMIGLIPLEPRVFKINMDAYVPVVWVTGAHVQPEYRSQGIGAMMDRQIAQFYPEAEAVLAYRQDEGTRAYQWYMKNGYKPLCPLVSLKKSVSPFSIEVDYSVHSSVESIKALEPEMLDFFERQMISWGGFPKRTPNFWSHVCMHHYYKHAYQYFLITIKEHGKIVAYAFTGITALRDGIRRLEMLESVFIKNEAVKQQLFNAAFDLAYKSNAQEVRVQCAQEDALKTWLEDAGFTLRWQTNIIGKSLKNEVLMFAQPKQWKYFQIDYI